VRTKTHYTATILGQIKYKRLKEVLKSKDEAAIELKRIQNSKGSNERDADKGPVDTRIEGEGGYCVLFFLSSLALSSPFLSRSYFPLPFLYPFFPHAKHLNEA
jgi:hypothetical protein